MDQATRIRRFYELISRGDIDGFGDQVAEDFVEHEGNPGFERSKAGVIQMFRAYRAAFPDLRMEAEDVLVDGDKAVARVAIGGGVRPCHMTDRHDAAVSGQETGIASLRPELRDDGSADRPGWSAHRASCSAR